MSAPKKSGVRIRMKFDFVFDTEDTKTQLPHVDINAFIAAGLRGLGYRRGFIESGAGFKATIVTRKKGSKP